ncbi:MAG: glycosyltransferase family 2 protein [Janthinobacterium lividum]
MKTPGTKTGGTKTRGAETPAKGKRPAGSGRVTALPPASASPRLHLRPAEIRIEFPAGGPALPASVALLIDGRMTAIAEVTAGGTGQDSAHDGSRASLALPPWAFGQDARIVSVPDGAELASLPDFAGLRSITDVQWGASPGGITGRFTVTGELAPPAATPIRVEVIEAGLVFAGGFAVAGEDGAHGFTLPLPRLPRIGVPFSLSLRLSGMATGPALTLPIEACGFAGYVEESNQPFVQGWLADLADPARIVTVEVSAGDQVIWSGPADIPRDDIRAFGMSDGLAGYRVPLPKAVKRDRPVTIAARIAGTATHLVNSPYVLPALPPYAGYFDALEDPFAGGWVVNMHHPDVPLAVEAICDGEVIGSGLADLFRGDVEKAGMPAARCGFRFIMERPVAELYGKDVYVRIAGTSEVLNGSPQQLNQNHNIVRFLGRRDAVAAPTLERLVRRMSHQAAGCVVSILMPVFNTRRDWLIAALNSVLGQWSPHWELICVDDGSTERHVAEVLDAAVRHDRRIRVMRSPGNLGIAKAINFGLRAANGEYVAFMDHDDVLEPDAIHRMASAARRTDADLLYSDEAITTSDIDSIVEVRARPAFSYDYYLSHPYFVHLICARTEIARQIGGWDETLSISADVDFVLRMIERSTTVTHVPGVLYRWRTHETSTGHTKQAQVTDTMLGVLNRHLARQQLSATATPGLRYNEYRIDWADDGGEVLIIIPTKNRVDLLKVAIDSIEKTSAGENYRIVVIDHESTDKRTVKYLRSIAGRHTVMPYSGPFNYALMNNLAVKTHGGDAKYVLFLNNDVEAREQGWLPRLRSLAARPGVGAVGCLLLYGDDRIQHAGVLMAFSGAADHAMKFKDAYLSKGARHPGYNCNLTVVRDYSAVTAACLMVPRNVLRAVKGFDEKFVIGFNDTDLCLRIGAAGYKVLYDGFTVLYHHESATRTTTNEVDHPEDDARLRQRWARLFKDGDPFYSPLLAPRGTDHTLRDDAGCKGRMKPRAQGLSFNGPVPKPVAIERSPAKPPKVPARVKTSLRQPKAAGV